MKKVLMSMASAVLALGLTTSCSEETPNVANYEVTFTVEMEGEQASRAYNDGKKATQLIFAVYEAGTENELKDLRKENVEVKDLTATVTTQLVKGKKYDFVFWAQPLNATTFDVTDMRHIKVSYQGANCNDDMRDAFYTVMNNYHAGKNATDTVFILTRPFAQINFATADWEQAKSAGVGEVSTAVAVQSVYTQLNTYDGSVAGETTAEFKLAAIPSGENETLTCDANGDTMSEEYRWLAMNYVLVPASVSMSNGVTLNVKGATVDNTVAVPNVQMQRNYRTNIVGNLLTTQTVFNVIIEPTPMIPDHNVPL